MSNRREEIGIYALKRQDPMHFWSGTKIDPCTISDIKAYNKVNAKMWIGYGLIYVLSSLLELLGISISYLLISLACFPGIFILILIYPRYFMRKEV